MCGLLLAARHDSESEASEHGAEFAPNAEAEQLDAEAEQLEPHCAEDADVDSGIDVEKQSPRRTSLKPRRPPNVAPASPPRPAPKGNPTSPTEPEPESDLRRELAATKALLAADKRTLPLAQEQIRRLQKAAKNITPKTTESYPYSFLPALPWDGEPTNLPMPPHVWKQLNRAPVLREHNPREGNRQFELRTAQYTRNKEQNRRDWLSGSLEQWPLQFERSWRGVMFLGAGSYGSGACG